MRSLSVSTHRGHVHWQWFLLVVSLLNFWSQPTTAQVTVESKDALEGTDVRLQIFPKFPRVRGFLWYKGRHYNSYNQIAYLYITPTSILRFPPDGQLMVENDGSLLLKNVTIEHAGIYTIMVELQGCQKLVACGQLNVYPLVSVPILLSSNTTVTENKDAVVMTCYTDADTVQWLFKGRNLTLSERIKLSRDHRVLTIDPVQRQDAGHYSCKGFNPRNSGQSIWLKLIVKSE